MKKKKIPMRKCIITNEMFPKKELIRVVKNKEGEIFVDSTGKKAGRGSYVCMELNIIENAKEKNILEKVFNSSSKEMEAIYSEIIRLIYRKSIPKK